MLIGLLLACGTAAPPVLGALPAFELIDERGRAVSDADLRGRVIIASFIFTRCTMSCPTITGHMETVSDRTVGAPGAPIEFLSVSVDPEHDTPQVLADFAATRSIPDERWTLLTGTVEQVDALSAGMMQALARPDGPAPDITHSQRLILVDAEGQLRAMPPAQAEELELLSEQAMLLSRTAR
ncbi:MAG: SCO family protein [Proteobacteria bacterium]|nr:SCO family protein [Pseudomonadota bacterium]